MLMYLLSRLDENPSFFFLQKNSGRTTHICCRSVRRWLKRIFLDWSWTLNIPENEMYIWVENLEISSGEYMYIIPRFWLVVKKCILVLPFSYLDDVFAQRLRWVSFPVFVLFLSDNFLSEGQPIVFSRTCSYLHYWEMIGWKEIIPVTLWYCKQFCTNVVLWYCGIVNKPTRPRFEFWDGNAVYGIGSFSFSLHT